MIPLFKSHYSLGRSILTLENPDALLENGPESIVNLALKNDFKEVFLVEDSISGFLQAYKNLTENNIKLNFGLRMNVCSDMSVRSEEELKKTCKYIVFCKNTDGYTRLIKISTTASRDGFYYQPRADFKVLKKFWSDEDLMLCVPFYDSFLFKNVLCGSTCMPDFSFTKPTFFTEDNDIPYEPLLKEKVVEYASANKLDLQEVKSVFYPREKDFKAYLTFRCINNRSTLNKPNLDHMCSDKFSLESWKELSNA